MFLSQILSVLYKLYCSDNILLAVLWPSPTHFRLSSSMRMRQARLGARRRLDVTTNTCGARYVVALWRERTFAWCKAPKCQGSKDASRERQTSRKKEKGCDHGGRE